MNPKHLTDPGRWRQRDFTRPWYAKALKLLPLEKKLTVLELGSGAGELAVKLKNRFNDFTASDQSPLYLSQLRSLDVKLIKANFNQPLPFKNRQFDLVISLEVIEHLAQAEAFLSEIRRILKPKGRLILSTPNIAWWGYRLFALLGRPPKKEGYHLRFFTHQTLTRTLLRAGFRVVKTASFTTLPFINRLLIALGLKPVYPLIKFWPNLVAQDLVFLCQKQ